jgi:hypothetical protein
MARRSDQPGRIRRIVLKAAASRALASEGSGAGSSHAAGRCQCLNWMPLAGRLGGASVLIGCRWLGGAAGKNPCGQVPVFYSMHVNTVPQFDGIKQNEVRRDSPDDQLVPIPVARRPIDVSSSQYSCDWQTSEPDFPSATPPATRSASCGSAIVRPER